MREEVISATEANRQFSRLLRRVAEGHSFIVTYHGKPVARIDPVGHVDASAATRERAHQALFERLRRQPVVDIGPWTRDELYDEE